MPSATRRCACSKSRKKQSISGPAARAHGDVLVRSQVVGFKKIKFFTNENVGSGKLELPENEMHTTAFWMTLEHELLAGLAVHAFRAAERHFRVALCAGVDGDTAADVRPPRPWHRRRRAAAERGERDRTGRISQLRQTSEQGVLRAESVLYDAYPGGIGFSEPLYRVCDGLLSRTREMISACPCENGCPSCVGPTADRSERTKEVALEILRRVCADAHWMATKTAQTT